MRSPSRYPPSTHFPLRASAPTTAQICAVGHGSGSGQIMQAPQFSMAYHRMMASRTRTAMDGTAPRG